MENKVISLLGVDYTEEKIQVLIDYLNHMEREVGPMSRTGSIIEYIIKSQQISDAYMAEQSKEDIELLEHFAAARETVGKNHPKLKLLINAITVLTYGTMSVAVPPIVNLGICAVLAKFVTNNIRNLSEKNAYNKIERLIKENLE
jgi:hypothetical protein